MKPINETHIFKYENNEESWNIIYAKILQKYE